MGSRGKRIISRAWLGLQRSLNVGAGRRLNTLEAYMAKEAEAEKTRADRLGGEGEGSGSGSGGGGSSSGSHGAPW